MSTIAIQEFAFFLDAVQYCRQHGIELMKIKRRDWKTWIIVE